VWWAAGLAIGQHHIGRDIVVTVSPYPTAPTPAPIGALGVLPNTARGFLFDRDGVLTQTAKQHRTVWKPMLDDFLPFLASRQLGLPTGTPDDPPGASTVHDLSNRKNPLVLKLIVGGDLAELLGRS
jgi:hypothetical protein